ncbi:MAG: peptidoglycan-associated lipoprotein Pal [Chlorobiaceae bacterium]|jgi:peptidoglycan-associated lipoprotein|nr:peptidoglycan-associated lipoprotein Pal [Chlorobiaceae bacterium]NTV16673.1 peptidoglycan-associated lipoprotein Pal [Chlorobiaceae bacterium]
MNRKINSIFVLALMVTAGCSSKSAVTTDDTSAPASSTLSSTTSSTPTGYGFDQWQTGPLGDVFFDYDSATLSEDAQTRLNQNGLWLEKNAAKGVLIEGHCDERGTSEYNLALGDRRATSAKEYLVRFGVAPARLETVSYGEERPFDSGHNEDAWGKNRRAHFIIK